jgi:hypothetical protein
MCIVDHIISCMYAIVDQIVLDSFILLVYAI